MKKIVFLLALLITGCFVRAQTNLITNGDFESGSIDPWSGNAANLQTENGNSFNLADVQQSGQSFDVNLSQVLSIEQGATYTMTFDASSDRNRTMFAGIGQNAAPFNADVQSVSLTDTTQSFTLTLNASNFGDNNCRVIFDMGAEVGIVVIDNVVLTKNADSGSGTVGEELVENGDFESGSIDPWIGNAANLQTENENSFNLADVQQAGQAFDVNLSQVLTIEQGATYTMTFDASSDRSRTMLAGIGQNAAPFNADVQSVSLTDATQTFTLTLTASNFGDSNCRVIFDMGAEVGIVIIDNVSLKQNEGNSGGGAETEPTTVAPTPAIRNAEDVFSIYSDAYVDQPGVDFGAFGVGAQEISTVTVDGDNFLKVITQQPEAQFLFADWGTTVNNSSMTDFHFDYWTDPNLKTGLIANPKFSNHVGDEGETQAFELNNPVNTFGEWVSIDIPISSMTSIPAGSNQRRDALRQFVLTVAGADNGSRTIYLDNIYLYKASIASIESIVAIDVSVYPNPTSDQWTVSTGGDLIKTIELFDLAGKRLLIAKPDADNYKMDGSNLSSGFYMARITTKKGQGNIKIIKR